MATCKNVCGPGTGEGSCQKEHGRETVFYVHSGELLKQAEKNPRVSGRVRIAKTISLDLCSSVMYEYCDQCVSYFVKAGLLLS